MHENEIFQLPSIVKEINIYQVATDQNSYPKLSGFLHHLKSLLLTDPRAYVAWFPSISIQKLRQVNCSSSMI